MDLDPNNVRDMPKSGMKRMIENEIPNDDLRLSNHSLTAFHHGMREMLNLLSNEIVSICNKTNRTIVTSGIIVSAVQNLGFDEYIEPLKHFAKLQAMEEAQKRRTKKRKSQGGTKMDEELIEEQERLIREATQKLYGNTKKLNSINAACKVDDKEKQELDFRDDDNINTNSNNKNKKKKRKGNNNNNDDDDSDDSDDGSIDSDDSSESDDDDEETDSESDQDEDDDMNDNNSNNTGFQLSLPSS